jgi:hypothetical protein
MSALVPREVCHTGALGGQARLATGPLSIALRSPPLGAERSEASARSAAQSIRGLGGRTPGRSLDTRTGSCRESLI